MSDKIKPCPFCGEKDFMVTVRKKEIGISIKCLQCRAISPNATGDEDDTADSYVVQAWNARPIEDAQAEQIEQLKAGSDIYKDDNNKLQSENNRFREALLKIANGAVGSPLVGFSLGLSDCKDIARNALAAQPQKGE